SFAEQPSLRPRGTRSNLGYSVSGVAARLFVGIAVLPAVDVHGRIDDALQRPPVERPGGHVVTLGFGGPGLATLSRTFGGWLIKNGHIRPLDHKHDADRSVGKVF